MKPEPTTSVRSAAQRPRAAASLSATSRIVRTAGPSQPGSSGSSGRAPVASTQARTSTAPVGRRDARRSEVESASPRARCRARCRARRYRRRAAAARARADLAPQVPLAQRRPFVGGSGSAPTSTTAPRRRSPGSARAAQPGRPAADARARRPGLNSGAPSGRARSRREPRRGRAPQPDGAREEIVHVAPVKRSIGILCRASGRRAGCRPERGHAPSAEPPARPPPRPSSRGPRSRRSGRTARSGVWAAKVGSLDPDMGKPTGPELSEPRGALAEVDGQQAGASRGEQRS